LKEAGYDVVGSDLQEFRMRKVLQQKGIQVFLKQEKSNILPSVSSVIYSTAVPASNPERMEADRLGIPSMNRIQALKAITRNSKIISITGSYGKSTTTTFVSSMFEQANLFPSWIIGADMLTYPCAKKDIGVHFVIETDESKPQFLDFSPSSLIVTNIGTDHLPNYKNDQVYLVEAIRSIVQRTNERVVVPFDLKEKYPTMFTGKKTITCGFQNGDYSIHNCKTFVQMGKMKTTFTVHGLHSQFDAWITMPSQRNVLDAVLSFALLEDIQGAVSNPSLYFSSLPVMERRFQLRSTNNHAYLIDDEGDSPEVIREVLKDAKRFFPTRLLVTVLQPHRYSRLQSLFSSYVDSVVESDIVVVLPVYAAGEESVDGVSSEILAREIEKKHHKEVFIPHNFCEAAEILQKFLQQESVVVTLGPGNVWKLYDEIT
jgi:UDP-N-acetylmuramate--alanine ligase